ncbi:MAG: ABC transporter substrate-binding protein [Aureliella sp.]
MHSHAQARLDAQAIRFDASEFAATASAPNEPPANEPAPFEPPRLKRSLQPPAPLHVRAIWLLALTVGWTIAGATHLRGQEPTAADANAAGSEPADEEVPLIDTPPFDVIVLTAEAGGQRVKVAPVENRDVSQRPSDSTKLQVVLLSHPDRVYQIAWRDIAKLELYEQMVYDEAVIKLAERDFIGAFMNLSFLMRNYPKTPNLEKLRRDFLYQSAAAAFAESKTDFNRYFQTMSTLEELRDSAPEYLESSVTAGLSRVTDTLMRYYKDKGDLASAKKMLERLEAAYGDSLPSVKTWKGEFKQLAEARKQEAVALMNAGKFREARKAALDMVNISSEVEGGAELLAEIRRVHPMVRVGVMQRASELDPGSLFSWSARRAGSLVYRPVVKFLETGSEGGRYQFALGKMKLSDDHQRLMLTVDPKIPADIDAFGLTQVLASRATPGSPDYNASWAAIVRSLATPSPTQIVVQLKQPYVLPHALMQFTLPDTDAGPTPLPGPYKVGTVDGDESTYVLRDKPEPSEQPVEIVEVFYEDPKVAINDLLRGEIDVLDQLYPGDARRYDQAKQIKTGSFALPSVHMLVPVSDNPFLANDKFRRALMYATNRGEILAGELINSQDARDGQLISGPFPIGFGKNDPLNYAHDPSIAPIPYEPQLARLLLFMADKEVTAQSIKLTLAPPEKKPLRLAVPNFELARVGAQALIQQWSLVGVKAELVLLPEGQAFDESLNCDLVYVTATMWEPAVDIERLLGGNGPAKSNNPFIVQALTRLRGARSWREVRTALQELHRLVDYHLPVLPLWQITDRFAYSRQLQGLSSGSVSLYQDIAAWRLGTPTVPVASRTPTP